MVNYYAGVGSRSTPKDIQFVMTEFARAMERNGWRLRSGGAAGADEAFEKGVINPANKEIFLPSKNFRQNPSPLYQEPSEEAYFLASTIHPAWERCTAWAKAAHARNCYQVLGQDLNTPVRFTVCWTPDGTPTGGTRTAIMLSRSRGIPVYNLYNSKDVRDITAFVATLNQQPY